MTWASVVFPVPGGPQKIADDSRSDSTSTRSGRPGPTRSSWPTMSSRRIGPQPGGERRLLGQLLLGRRREQVGPLADPARTVVPSRPRLQTPAGRLAGPELVTGQVAVPANHRPCPVGGGLARATSCATSHGRSPCLDDRGASADSPRGRARPGRVDTATRAARRGRPDGRRPRRARDDSPPGATGRHEVDAAADEVRGHVDEAGRRSTDGGAVRSSIAGAAPRAPGRRGCRRRRARAGRHDDRPRAPRPSSGERARWLVPTTAAHARRDRAAVAPGSLELDRRSTRSRPGAAPPAARCRPTCSTAQDVGGVRTQLPGGAVRTERQAAGAAVTGHAEHRIGPAASVATPCADGLDDPPADVRQPGTTNAAARRARRPVTHPTRRVCQVEPSGSRAGPAMTRSSITSDVAAPLGAAGRRAPGTSSSPRRTGHGTLAAVRPQPCPGHSHRAGFQPERGGETAAVRENGGVTETGRARCG